MATRAERELVATDVTPVNYALDITPDFEKLTFDGIATITCTVHSSTDKVEVNTNTIEIQTATAQAVGADGSPTGPQAASEAISFDKETETSTIKFAEPLKVGEVQLVIKYLGVIGSNLKGFYWCDYQDREGKTQKMGVTQFEPVDARRAFPCWDEPSHKATFDISLTVPSKLEAHSNMPVKNTTACGDKTRYDFDRSPKMSTYLVAWIIGEFDKMEKKVTRKSGKGDITTRILTVPGKAAKVQFALDVAVRCIGFYEEYFGIDYPLEKSDLVAVPNFAAGAMENWGLVTYRETKIFITEESPVGNQKAAAMTICHELAHMWFGNLVTMEWWDGLWLNEGFARFMQFFSVDKLFPHWNMWDDYIASVNVSALSMDALLSSHPIQVPIAVAAKVDEIFDAISYSKGGCVVRMVQKFIGDEAFQKGLSNYLKKHSYGNTVTTDLWDAFGEASGKPVSSIMQNWTLMQGYPIVTVALEGEDLVVEQHRFLQTGPAPEDEDQVVWSLPLKVGRKGQDPVEVLVSERRQVLPGLGKGSEWVLLNAGATVPCLFSYSQELQDRLGGAIKAGELPVQDRHLILYTQLACAKAGLVDIKSLFHLLECYVGEESVTVLPLVIQCFRATKNLLDAKEDRQAIDRVICEFLEPVARSIGWFEKEGESWEKRSNREAVISAVVSSRSEEFTQDALKYFQSLVVEKKQDTVPQALIDTVALAGVRDGGRKEFDALWEFIPTTFVVARDGCNMALGSCKDTEVSDVLLSRILSGEVKNQDIPFVYAGLATNLESGIYLKTSQHIRDNFSALVANLGPGFMLSRSTARSASGLRTNAEIDEVEAWWATLPAEETKSVKMAFSQGVEVARARCLWADRAQAGIKQWLDSKKK